jgi:hypothetical protein
MNSHVYKKVKVGHPLAASSAATQKNQISLALRMKRGLKYGFDEMKGIE